MRANPSRCRCVPSTLQQPLSSQAQLRYRVVYRVYLDTHTPISQLTHLDSGDQRHDDGNYVETITWLNMCEQAVKRMIA